MDSLLPRVLLPYDWRPKFSYHLFYPKGSSSVVALSKDILASIIISLKVHGLDVKLGPGRTQQPRRARPVDDSGSYLRLFGFGISGICTYLSLATTGLCVSPPDADLGQGLMGRKLLLIYGR
jgi:hypothetical protein